MTDCMNAEMRDLLPDLAAEALSTAETSRVGAHVAGCSPCADELALIRQVRGLRAPAVEIDVGAIVAKLPRPTPGAAPRVTAPHYDRGVVSLDARRLAATHAAVGRRSLANRARGAWRVAAALGVIVAGGWSIMMVRSGGIPNMQMQADSVPLTDLGAGVSVPNVTANEDGGNTPIADTSPNAQATEGAAISFGAMNDLTDEELTRVLDRLEQWDGATSVETTTTRPILLTTPGEARQ